MPGLIGGRGRGVACLGSDVAIQCRQVTRGGFLSILGRGVPALLLGAILITLLLLVTFDLDRPTRGLIRVPDTPLVALRASMELPPAAAAPTP